MKDVKFFAPNGFVFKEPIVKSDSIHLEIIPDLGQAIAPSPSPVTQEFKDGDILFKKGWFDNNWLFIYHHNKGFDGTAIQYHALYSTRTDSIQHYEDFGIGTLTDSASNTVRYATPEETNLVLAAIEKDGKHWDSDKKITVDRPWKPIMHEVYYYLALSSAKKFGIHIWIGDSIGNYLFENGLLFRTEEEVLAKADELLKTLNPKNI